MSSESRPITPNPGSELDPVNFVGRADTTARAMLRAKQRILISDPRRMGKTFWIKAFAKQTDDERDYRLVSIDFQGMNSTEEFLTQTAKCLAEYRKLPDRFIKRLAAWFDNVDVTVSTGPVTLKSAIRGIGKTPVELLENLLTQLDNDLAKDGGVPLVIAMDEVPDAVQTIVAGAGADEGRDLLKRLRHLRNTTRRIRWIVAGSVGFHHVLADAKATEDVISDLRALEFGPLNDTDAAELAHRLILGIFRSIDAAAIAAAVRLTDGIPSLIQAIFDLMRLTSDGRSTAKMPITADEVRRCLDDYIDDRDQSRDATQYVTRIQSYYGQNASLAYTVLDSLAPAAAPRLTFQELADRMADNLGEAFDHQRFLTTYDNLVDDHYLIEQGGQIGWRYEVIRTIYRRRRNLGG